MSRRLVGALVSGQLIAEIAKKTLEKAVAPVPETAKFHSAHFDNMRNCFVAIFEDDSLSEVPEGGLIPMIYDIPLISEVPE